MILELDRESLLVHVRAEALFSEVEAGLRKEGLTLDARHDGTVGAWLEEGAPGARSAWLDPADHLVAGWIGRVGGKTFEIRPSPRRAVGPDLLSLVLGTKGVFLALESVWLRVHRVGVERPRTDVSPADAEPLTKDERALFEAIRLALE